MSIKEWLANYLWHLAKRGLPKAEDQHSLYLYHFLPLSGQILTYLKAEIEKSLLTDEEIRAIWSTMVDRHGSAQRGLIGFDFEHTLAQAQAKKIIELLGE